MNLLLRFPLLSPKGSLAFCRERTIPGVEGSPVPSGGRDIPHCLFHYVILSFPHLTLLVLMYLLLASKELKRGVVSLARKKKRYSEALPGPVIPSEQCMWGKPKCRRCWCWNRLTVLRKGSEQARKKDWLGINFMA